MLYHFFYWLTGGEQYAYHSPMFRATMAVILGFVIVWALGPRVTDHRPDGDVNMPLSLIELTFNEDMLPSSFTSDDIVINGPEGEIAVDEIITVDPFTFRWITCRLAPPKVTLEFETDSGCLPEYCCFLSRSVFLLSSIALLGSDFIGTGLERRR